MKSIRILFTLTLSVLLGLTSCEESVEVGEFDNWQQRNTLFIDSIAQVARENAFDDWKIILAEGLDDSKQWGNECYVYCQVLEDGYGTAHPLFTDSVLVNYSGRLMPSATYPAGYRFDSSYSGDFNPSFNVPVGMTLSGTVPGFYTAVQNMVDGDTWKVYIPYQLGYGERATSGIPAYSTLIFDINLVSFYR
jgi:FKBP-type peptidyl-prolyl cis-trans isomerase FklB